MSDLSALPLFSNLINFILPGNNNLNDLAHEAGIGGVALSFIDS